MSLRERTTNFAFGNFFAFSSFQGFTLCLFERKSRILPSAALHSAFPQWIFIVSLREGTTDFALSGLPFSSLVDTVSPQRELSQVLPLVVFFLLLNSQQFCPPKDPFYFIVVMCGCVDSWASTYKWFLLLAFDLRYLKETKSKEGDCRHSNLYRSILMVPSLSDDNLRSLIWWMWVENHLESSRKRVEKLPLT